MVGTRHPALEQLTGADHVRVVPQGVEHVVGDADQRPPQRPRAERPAGHRQLHRPEPVRVEHREVEQAGLDQRLVRRMRQPRGDPVGREVGEHVAEAQTRRQLPQLPDEQVREPSGPAAELDNVHHLVGHRRRLQEPDGQPCVGVRDPWVAGDAVRHRRGAPDLGGVVVVEPALVVPQRGLRQPHRRTGRHRRTEQGGDRLAGPIGRRVAVIRASSRARAGAAPRHPGRPPPAPRP